MNQPQIHTRIVELAPRLIAYSHFIHSPLDSADIQQEMALALLERDQVDPAFSVQEPSYLAWYATWQAKHAAGKARTYAGHIQPVDDAQMEIILCGKSDEDDDPARIAEKQEEMEMLLAQVATLTPENQAVIRMTYLGYSTKEIAAELGISPPAVSQRKKTIRRNIASQAE